jgi:hypothetical protein
MDREFIEKNQIVERYLAGKLPPKGAQDFERYCRDHPEFLEDINFSERLQAGMRLLEVSGLEASGPETAVYQPPQPVWWRRIEVIAGLAALTLVLALSLWVLNGRYAERGETIAALEKRVRIGSLIAPTRARTINVSPDRAPTSRVSLRLELKDTSELVELLINVSYARYNTFRVTVDKKDQGRGGTIHNLLRDSNGNLRLIVNSSAFSPGDYKVVIEGLSRRGPVAVGWVTLRVFD